MRRFFYLLFCLVFALPFLVAQTPCSITLFFNTGAGIACDDNGTPNDPSDDTFTFQVEVIGAGFGNNGWIGSDPLSSTGPYDQIVTLGPYLISNGPFNFSAQDVDDPSCETTQILITPPAPCSTGPACDINYSQIGNVTCSDNGTPNDPSDDTFTFIVQVVGTGTSPNGWTINDPLNTSGQYGVITTMGPYPISGGGFTVIATDNDDPNCSTIPVTIVPPAPCSTPANCDLTNPGLGFTECNDNGTPNDPSDDFYTFPLNPVGTGLGSGYTVSVSAGTVSPPGGNYGMETVFTLTGVAPPQGISVIVTDNDDPNCTTNTIINLPPTCSNGTPCDINVAQIGNVTCGDNGTPNDPSDDTFTFILQVVGTGTSPSGWTASDPLSTTGQYGVVTTMGPYPISGGGFTVIATDNDDPNCSTSPFGIVPPAPCSNPASCNIQDAGLFNVACNDAGTPADPSDDFITFSLSPTGQNLGDQYQVTVSSGTIFPSVASYGPSTGFETSPGTAGNGDITLTITDVNNASCALTITLPDPGNCSTVPACNLQSANLSGVSCNDSGTPADPDDDSIEFVLNPNGQNTGATYTVTSSAGSVLPSTGTYGSPTAFQTSPGTAGNGPITLTITDANDPACSITVSLPDPGTCSNTPPCTITDPGVVSVSCDDNGTPNDPSDDFVLLELLPIGVTLSPNGYILTSADVTVTPGNGNYGFATTFQLLGAAAAGNSITLTIADVDDPNCQSTFTINNPAPCSVPVCDIQPSIASTPACDPAGTPTIPDDDQFTVNIFVGGTGNGWQADDPANTTGTYGTSVPFGPFPISGGPVTLTFTDLDDPNCQQTLVIDPPPTCSDLCNILPLPSPAVCDPAGTPFDPSDDIFFVDIQVNGTGTGWQADDPSSASGTFGQTTTFGPFPINGGAVTLNFSLLENPNCQESIIVNPPPTCSDACDIQTSIDNISCDDNGTPASSDDDFFTAVLTVSGINVGTDWSAGAPANTSGIYGSPVAIGPFPTSQTSVTFTVSDTNNPNCNTTVTIDSPGGCSAGCPNPDSTFLSTTSCSPLDTGLVVETFSNSIGCDSLVFTTTTLLPSDTTLINLESCNPQDTGTVETLLVNEFGCDSLIVETTTLLPTDTTFLQQSSCNPLDTGTVETLLTNQFGCDSLIITTTAFQLSDTTLLFGESCNPQDTGIVETLLQNQFGCDSLIVSTTTLLSSDTTLISLESCNTMDTGTVETLLQNQFGCDSLIVTTTTLLPSDTIQINLESCNPQDTGTVETLLQNQFGCDSLIVTTTTLLPSDTTLISLESCNPQDTGTVETLLQNQFGCDSLIVETTSLLPTDTTLLQQTSCNPQDTGTVETLLANQFGCDSLVITTTAFQSSDTTQLFSESCSPQDTGTVETLLQNQFGCDSLVVTTTTLLPSDTMQLFAESCNPQDTGTAQVLLQNQFGCDSLVVTTTTLLPSDTTQLNAESCNPQDTGVAEVLLQNQFGCDSLVVTTTTLLPSDTTQLNTQSCNPQDTGTVETLLQNQFGCDSLVVTTTTLLPSDTTQLNAESCNPQDTGVAEVLLQNQFGCDSLVITTTSLLPSDTTQLMVENCNPQDTGIAQVLLQNQFGCDSLVVTTTTLLPSDTTQLMAESCNPQDTGTAQVLLQNQFGCDSLVVTTTTLLPSDTTQLMAESCNPQDTGTAQVLLQNQFGCDSLIVTTTTLLPSDTTQLIAESCNPQDTGITQVMLQNQFGCDSLVIETTTLLPSDTTQLNAQSCNPQDTGITEVLLQNQFGCDSLVITTTTLLPSSSSKITPFVCFGDSLTVNGTLYSADTPSGVDTLTAANGCDSLVFVTLQISPQPQVQQIDTVLCAGEQLAINGQVYDEGQPTGTQIISGQSGCDSLQINITATFNEVQLNAQAEQPACEGLPGRIVLESVTGGSPPYSYGLNGEGGKPLDTLPLVLEGLFPGDYSLQLTDGIGCTQEQSLSVAEGLTPVVELGADLTAVLGDSLFLNPSINFAYDSLVWTPGEAVSCDGCLNPAVTATESVTISLLAYDLQGCEAEDDIRILVDRRSSVYAPNIFSPNDDGRNDYFTLFADLDQVANIRRLAIFDRWGNQVFEGANLTPNAAPQGWNGRYKGELMDPAVFVFFAEVELADGSVELIEGEITLLR